MTDSNIQDDVKDAAQRAARSTRDNARAFGERITSEARERVTEMADEQKDVAEDYLDAVRRAIDAASRQLRKDGLDVTASYVDVAADKLGNASRGVERIDIAAMTRGVESFIIRRPGVSLGAGLLLGFAAVQLFSGPGREPVTRRGGRRRTP